MDITVTATASPAGWRHTIHQYVELGPSHVIKFSITGNSWGVCVKKSGNIHWVVGLGSSGTPTVDRFDGSNYTQVASRTTSYSGAMDVIVAFAEVRFGSSDDIWHTVAMWINGLHVINYTVAVGNALTTPLLFGLAVLANNTKTFTNIVIPQLGEQAEVATIDTNESPAGGLQRTIVGRYLKYLVRYNGALYAWKPEPMDGIILDDNDGATEQTHNDQIRTHVRMVGAYDFAEFTNDTLIKKYGYGFFEDNNPYLMSEQDAYTEAENTVRRLLETSVNGNVQNDAIHFLETEDGLVVNGNRRLINGFTLSYRGPQVEHSLGYRGDYWDEV